MTRSLITGIGGFAGQHLAAQLLAAGTGAVYGIARRPVAWRDPALAESPDLQVLTADLASPDDVRQALSSAAPDNVYLLASLSAPAAAFRDPVGVIQNNIACVLNLFEALRERAPYTRVLLVSSAEVYGRGTVNGSPVPEEAPLAPENPYAVSKAAQDLLGYQYHRAYGMPIVRVRPFSHIGPGQSDAFVAAAFARQIVEAEAGIREPVVAVGNLDARRDFTDVRDMVHAYGLALEKGTPGRAYNLASGVATPIRSLLEGLLGRSRMAISVQVDPQRLRPADAPILVGDASHFRQLTGWQPQVPLDRTLDDILAEWRCRVGPA